MYELSRVRLHAVGPKGARYQDVTLDLRRSLSSRPSGASVLFLENGGGKTVLVRLIFSVILPGRRQVVGTSNSKVLEKFVKDNDDKLPAETKDKVNAALKDVNEGLSSLDNASRGFNNFVVVP